MKLLRAEFQNFRMLRDLELNFSNGPDSNLTVIRAANESGKTTILHGLQWALYGDAALPGKGADFRLHPIDWDGGVDEPIPITATVDFESTKYRRRRDEIHESRKTYRLVRSALEGVDSWDRRSASTVKLFELTATGAIPIPAPEAQIEDELPPELREVFFTDGDRALSFIEADVATVTKRKRVQGAIRSLLGLGVIDAAIKHVRKSATEVNKKAQNVGGDSELTKVATRLVKVEKRRQGLEDDLERAIQQFSAFDEKLDEVDREISAILQKGDKEKLRTELDHAREEIQQLDNQLKEAIKEHSALFRSRSLASDLLAPALVPAIDKLEEMHDQGKIPNTTVPVLFDRLKAEVCVCGETLRPGESGADRRRAHVQQLIDGSRRADEIHEIITELYFGAIPTQVRNGAEVAEWLDEYKRVIKRREGIQSLREEAGRKFRALERQLDSLPNADIQGLRQTHRDYKAQRDRFLAQQSTFETQLAALTDEHEALRAERDRLLSEQKKGARILAEVAVTQDVMRVLDRAYQQITNEELKKVSERMNGIFLKMIGADPDQGAIIRCAEISRDFDIIVYGPDDRKLDPDRDLNGASRRALTFAFILALTKVSDVEAPNVIDTPLGMTSGYVKWAILRTAVQESAQLILFLTHDEIAGCEDIIDQTAGVVFTLTNPAHYPKMLVNDPGVVERKVLRCNCGHRSECELCQRRPDTDVELDVA